MSSNRYGFTYEQLYSEFKTSIIPFQKDIILPKEIKFWPARMLKYNEKLEKALLSPSGKTIFYLFEYISRTKDGAYNPFIDSRSTNLVLAFKNSCNPAKCPPEIADQIIGYIADILASEIPNNCALMAVPPSKVAKNGKTAENRLIQKIISLPVNKNIIDASDCLIRTKDIESSHLSHQMRDVSTQINTITVQNPDKFKGRPVLLLDDITSSGTSFEACRQLIEEQVKTVVCFAVGRTLDESNMKPAFILDIDGTLFDSETGDIKNARNLKKWVWANTLAKKLPAKEGALELIRYIKNIGAKYYLVTSSPRGYAEALTHKLRIDEEHIITYYDTEKHKPHIEPYMLAKQKMQVYEPFTIVIGDKEEDIIPAKKLGMTAILINSDNAFTLADYKFTSLEECLKHLPEIGVKIKEDTWTKFAKSHQQKNIEHTNKSLYKMVNQEAPRVKVSTDKDDDDTDFNPTINSFVYALTFSDLAKVGKATINKYKNRIFSISSDEEAVEQYQYIRTKTSVKALENLRLKEMSLKVNAAKKALKEGLDKGIKPVTYLDSEFSKLLHTANYAKGSVYCPFFFTKGNISLLNKPSMAIMSTNFLDTHIQSWSKYFIRQIYNEGWIIIIRLQDAFGKFCLEFCNEQKLPCLVISDVSIDKVKEQDLKTIEDIGGCIISLNHQYLYNNVNIPLDHMKLHLDLANAIYAFGYPNITKEANNTDDDTSEFYHIITASTYYKLLRDSEKPICCYKGNNYEQQNLQILKVNRNLLRSVPNTQPLQRNQDIRDFLNKNKSAH